MNVDESGVSGMEFDLVIAAAPLSPPPTSAKATSRSRTVWAGQVVSWSTFASSCAGSANPRLRVRMVDALRDGPSRFPRFKILSESPALSTVRSNGQPCWPIEVNGSLQESPNPQSPQSQPRAASCAPLRLVVRRLRRRLPAKHAAAAIGMREPPLLGDHIRHWRPGRAPLDPAGLVVEPFERGELVVLSKLRLRNRRLHDARSSRHRPLGEPGTDAGPCRRERTRSAPDR